MSIIILLIAFIIIGVPVSVALGMASIIPGIIHNSFTASPTFIIRSMVGGIDSFPLLAIPMFILSGIIMSKSGMSKKLFDIFCYFIGKYNAGMPCAVIITCLFFSSMSGSAPATVAAVGSMSIPMLVNLGYDKTFSTVIVAVAGGLGVILPPSIPFILYGMASGQSVGNLFIAGIFPAFLVSIFLLVYVILYCRKNTGDVKKIQQEVSTLKQIGIKNLLLDSIWALLMPVIILSFIYKGVASPTEVAVISVFYSLAISMFVYKTIHIKDIPQIFIQACKTFAPLLFILSASIAFSRVLTLLHLPQTMSDWILGNFSSTISILIVVNLFLLVIGMIMDTTPAILIVTPILLPIVEATGIDAVHFGVIMIVNLAIGFVTPPLGVNLYVASSLSNIPVMKIGIKALPMIGYFIIALLLITFIPIISLAFIR